MTINVLPHALLDPIMMEKHALLVKVDKYGMEANVSLSQSIQLIPLTQLIPATLLLSLVPREPIGISSNFDACHALLVVPAVLIATHAILAALDSS